MSTGQTFGSVFDYWVDACQRGILSLDILRQRADALGAHAVEPVPDVLTFKAGPPEV